MSDTVSLKEHIEKILAEKDKAINIALEAAEKSSIKTEQAQRDYNHTHNDLLRKMDEQHKATIPREEYESMMKQKDDRFYRTIDQLKATSEERHHLLLDSIKILNDYKTSQQGSIKIILWLVGIGVSILVGIVIKLLVSGL